MFREKSFCVIHPKGLVTTGMARQLLKDAQQMVLSDQARRTFEYRYRDETKKVCTFVGLITTNYLVVRVDGLERAYAFEAKVESSLGRGTVLFYVHADRIRIVNLSHLAGKPFKRMTKEAPAS